MKWNHENSNAQINILIQNTFVSATFPLPSFRTPAIIPQYWFDYNFIREKKKKKFIE